MHVTEPIPFLAFDLQDEEGNVFVTASGQPSSNTWKITVPHPSKGGVNKPPSIIAHGNTEDQLRHFMASLADAFNRHGELQ